MASGYHTGAVIDNCKAFEEFGFCFMYQMYTKIKEQYNEFKVAIAQFQRLAIHGHLYLYLPSPNLDYFEGLYWRVLNKGMTFNSLL